MHLNHSKTCFIIAKKLFIKLQIIRSYIDNYRLEKMKAPGYLILQWNLESNLDELTSMMVVDAIEWL